VSSILDQGEVTVQHNVIKFVSDFRQVGGFLRVHQFHSPIKLTARYNRNSIESGVKHHKPTSHYCFFGKEASLCINIKLSNTLRYCLFEHSLIQLLYSIKPIHD
jgi:hypothetical protein